MRKITGREAARGLMPNHRDVVYDPDALTNEELDALPYGMIQLDEKGTVLRYSTPETRISGVTADECVGRSVFDEIAPRTHGAEFYGRFVEGVRAERLDVTFNFQFAFHPPRDVQVRMFYSKVTRSVRVRVIDRPAEGDPRRGGPATP